ncbi:DNA damage-inducible transcript 3 protein [Sceloporus undulatus]|uniref:DNA damage-inducible transcript 3 protein n=1 Tax=Sceloporus undulatus TaxID=8520 RepID=UPI001C4D2BDB|nr:DNA damage-inducible transcript 3 protein [Sceloporus undulatus]XP_042305180.1 DNA damage-inducible transcript 3 protein [Sceloporus undulatus]
MMAESLPFSVGTPVPTWDLESWYEDLQEVLSLDVTSRTDPPDVGGQELEEFSLDSTALLWNLETSDPLEPSGGTVTGACELEPDLTTELLELLGEEPTAAPESDSSHSSPPQTGTDDDEVSTSRKRKRSGQPQGGKRQCGREREQQNEHRVAELMAQNEHLQREIERLSAEVEATRAALIQRMVSLKN